MNVISTVFFTVFINENGTVKNYTNMLSTYNNTIRTWLLITYLYAINTFLSRNVACVYVELQQYVRSHVFQISIMNFHKVTLKSSLSISLSSYGTTSIVSTVLCTWYYIWIFHVLSFFHNEIFLPSFLLTFVFCVLLLLVLSP